MEEETLPWGAGVGGGGEKVGRKMDFISPPLQMYINAKEKQREQIWGLEKGRGGRGERHSSLLLTPGCLRLAVVTPKKTHSKLVRHLPLKGTMAPSL